MFELSDDLTFKLSYEIVSQESAMVFMSVLAVTALVLSALSLVRWRATRYLEKAGYWTLRLRLALLEPFLLTAWVLSSGASLARSLYFLSSRISQEGSNVGLPDYLGALITHLAILATFVLGIDLSYRTLKSRRYLTVRWKAWSGPSRTGIPPSMAEYIGGPEDWKIVSRSNMPTESHAADRFSGSLMGSQSGILWDPTDLLRIQALRDEMQGHSSKPATEHKAGVYQPCENGISVSLLWGQNLGFQPRCSRGIVSVPRYLLRVSPTLKNGLSAEPLCLAFGILSRNKGLEPRSLVCNLKSNNSFRQWEEAGMWPHPAKTLRGFYYKELDKAFSLLGEAYVTAATELALLLADLDYGSIGWWLDRHFEHQDLEFNQAAHNLGANHADLDRLYRGHYAAMLISLNSPYTNARPNIRPELAVFDAICQMEDIPAPNWASAPPMQARRREELVAYGPSLKRLLQAII